MHQIPVQKLTHQQKSPNSPQKKNNQLKIMTQRGKEVDYLFPDNIKKKLMHNFQWDQAQINEL